MHSSPPKGGDFVAGIFQKGGTEEFWGGELSKGGNRHTLAINLISDKDATSHTFRLFHFVGSPSGGWEVLLCPGCCRSNANFVLEQ